MGICSGRDRGGAAIDPFDIDAHDVLTGADVGAEVDIGDAGVGTEIGEE